MYINISLQSNCIIHILWDQQELILNHHQWFLEAAILAANLSSSSGRLTWVFICADRLFILWNILQRKPGKHYRHVYLKTEWISLITTSILQESREHLKEQNTYFFQKETTVVQEALKNHFKKDKTNTNCHEAKRRLVFYTYKYFILLW